MDISWTRGGRVFTEHADHTSQIMFLETWLEALGYSGVQTTEIPEWRRAHMSNLVNAFDFDHPDYSIPFLPEIPTPHTNSNGDWDSASLCEAEYGHYGPPIPYGPENEALDPSTLCEEGFKSVRGYLTEGRYLVFEMNGFALTNPGFNNSSLVGTLATPTHNDKRQRWVVHATGGTAVEGGAGAGMFTVNSALDGRYVHASNALAKSGDGAEVWTIADLGNGLGYTLSTETGGHLTINQFGIVGTSESSPVGFQIYSVTYQ